MKKKNKIKILFKKINKGHESCKNKNSNKNIFKNSNINFIKFFKENKSKKNIEIDNNNKSIENNSLSKISENSVSAFNTKIKYIKKIKLDNESNYINNNNYYTNSPICKDFYNYYINLNNKFNYKSNKNIIFQNNKININVKFNLNHHLDLINDIKFLDDENIISCSNDCLVKIFNINNRKKEVFRNSNSPIFSLDYNKINKKILVGNSSGNLQIYNYKLGKLIFDRNYLVSKNYPIYQIISSNNNYIASNSIDLFFSNNLKNGFSKINKNKFKENIINFINEDELFIADKNKFNIYNLEQIFSKKLTLKNFDFENKILKFKMLNNKLFLLGKENGSVIIFDKNQLNKEIHQFKAHQDDITSFIINENDYLIGTTSHDCKIRFWDIRTFKCLSDNLVN